MSTEKDISNWWDVFLLSGGVVAVLNYIRAFKRQPKVVESELEKILREKDKIIESLEKRIEQYQKILEYDERSRSGME